MSDKEKERSFLNMRNPWGYSDDYESEENELYNTPAEAGSDAEDIPQEDMSRLGGRMLLIAAAVLLFLALVGACMDSCRQGGDNLPVMLSGGDISASDVSDGDAPAQQTVSDSNVIYYSAVTIEGYDLPEQYGDGLLNADAVIWLINEYRSRNGLHQLVSGDPALDSVAALRLSEVMENFQHDRPDGTRFYTAYDQLGIGYRRCAENLAYGQYTAGEVVLDWMQSASHNAILLDPDVMYISVAVESDEEYRPVWVLALYTPTRG